MRAAYGSDVFLVDNVLEFIRLYAYMQTNEGYLLPTINECIISDSIDLLSMNQCTKHLQKLISRGNFCLIHYITMVERKFPFFLLLRFKSFEKYSYSTIEVNSDA